jgi:predicted ATPase
MLHDLTGIDENDPVSKMRQALEEVVASYCHPSEVRRVASRLELALELEGEDRDESSYVQEVQSGFQTLIEGLAQQGPVVLVFDDIHEAGTALLDLIERLAGRSRNPGPLFVVAAGRPQILELRPSWGSTAVNHTLVRIELLGELESVELARQAGGGALRESTAARIAERAGGNPFFIVETTGMLLNEDQTRPMHLGAPLPPTVQAVVAARLDQLPPNLRDLARRVSAFLYSFDLAELAVVSDAEEVELKELEELEILVREDRGDRPGRDGIPHARWRFRHETLREVAYASLPKRERLRLHLAIAEYLRKESRRSVWAADHFERAALASLDLNPGDRSLPERAADALAEAGDLARRRMEGKAALDFYERSLAMSGPEDGWGVREARVLAGMGESRYWLGEYRAATESLDRAIALGEACGDHWARSLALRFRGDIALNIDGDIDAAQSMLERSLAASEKLKERIPLIRSLLFAGWVPWTRDDYPTAEEMWTRALDMAREENDRWAQIRALTSIASLRLEAGQHEEARELVEQALALATDLGDQFSVAVATAALGRINRYDEKPEEALPHLDRAVAIFSELGARWELADVLGERGDSYRMLGRLEEAESDLSTSLRLSEELGERQLASWTWRQLAKVALRRGDRAAAEERFRRADEEKLRMPR